MTHDDLVNLLATATEGCGWLEITMPQGSYKGTSLEDDDDCREDAWAKVLLAGGHLNVYDGYAEDETDFYGTLTHRWSSEEEDGGYDAMEYQLTLEDIKRGLEKAFSSQDYISTYAHHLIEDDGMQLDLTEAEALMQYILFGEEIYG